MAEVTELSERMRAKVEAERDEVRSSALLPLIWARDAEPLLDTPYVVKKVIGLGELIVVYGVPKSGKTFFVTDMALHVAATLPWFDHRLKGGLVIYIASEMGRRAERRVRAWLDHRDTCQHHAASFDAKAATANSRRPRYSPDLPSLCSSSTSLDPTPARLAGGADRLAPYVIGTHTFPAEWEGSNANVVVPRSQPRGTPARRIRVYTSPNDVEQPYNSSLRAGCGAQCASQAVDN